MNNAMWSCALTLPNMSSLTNFSTVQSLGVQNHNKGGQYNWLANSVLLVDLMLISLVALY